MHVIVASLCSDVCWTWTVSGCQDKWYYGGGRCESAKCQILDLIHMVNDKGEQPFLTVFIVF